MRAVILAGGLGTRISEETAIRPKPMIEIGGKPLLWHIMKIYGTHGINDFIICLGYKGYMIKEYFSNYYLHTTDVTLDIARNSMEIHESVAEPWKITLIDTGDDTMTGGRLRRVARHVGDETFCMTYGDGLSDVDISAVLRLHRDRGRAATVTAVQPPGRFGALAIRDGLVQRFEEKPEGDGAWINGGFFVLEPTVFDLLHGDDDVWEQHPMRALAETQQLTAYQHTGFWQPLDTVREKQLLEEHWKSGKAPWQTWK